MAIIVVGGSGRNIGKTSLVCGLIAALDEFRWTAVKISAHDHGKPKPVWEETETGPGTDTARYLADGAERALLVTAEGDELGAIVRRLVDAHAHAIFESNSVLRHVKPDVCLAVHSGLDKSESKPSFSLVVRNADAMVVHSDGNQMVGGDGDTKPLFQLAKLEKISPEMLAWVRLKLSGVAR
jgi:hypothetical protein